MLAVSGRLDRTVPGPHPFPPVQRWTFNIHQPFHAIYDSDHRSLYLMAQRNRRHPFLALFDAADPNLSVSTILTTDDLPKVAAWYHDHLPGWSEQNLGQMAMFWPPDRKADPRTLWLVVDPKTGQTGAILWKPSKKAP